MADDIPCEALAGVFDHLNAVACFQARAVCRAWHKHATAGCIYLDFDGIGGYYEGGKASGGSYCCGGEPTHWQLLGHRERLVRVSGAVAPAEPETCTSRSRTSGHLPAPVVLGADAGVQLENAPPLHACAGMRWKYAVGARVEGGGPEWFQWSRDDCTDGGRGRCGGYCRPPRKVHYYDPGNDACKQERVEEGWLSCGRGRGWILRALDLSLSTVQPIIKSRDGDGNISEIVGGYFLKKNRKPRPMGRLLARRADVSGLRWLRSLSLKGCAGLREVLLPPGLTALDASTSNLEAAAFVGCGSCALAAPTDLPKLETLTLANCRKLTAHVTCHRHTSNVCFRIPMLSALMHCRELDLSWCNALPPNTIAESLRYVHCLISVSLRSVASDAILDALGTSDAACSGKLKLMDCAFSKALHDAAVVSLVQHAIGLQRINLRGCSAVSAHCYNQTPILLRARAKAPASGVGGAAAERLASGDPSPPRKIQRTGGTKGDNVFLLLSDSSSR